jgi:hypothetical protein
LRAGGFSDSEALHGTIAASVRPAGTGRPAAAFQPNKGGWIAVLVAINLAVNLIFFMTHPIFTPYYIIPIDMLSALDFAVRNAICAAKWVAESAAFPQPANA